MLKVTSNTGKRIVKFIFILIGIIHMTSCSESTFHAQQNMVITVDDDKQSLLLLDIVQKFASDNEYDHKTQAGNAEYLSQQGKFQVVIKSTSDNSFVSINNILKKRCVSISVYSSGGEQLAKEVMDKIRQKIIPVIGINRKEEC
tara:strand:+ start:873 stop:1304 length:432 start_codon:yes stop_codon:yes gene_type:complete